MTQTTTAAGALPEPNPNLDGAPPELVPTTSGTPPESNPLFLSPEQLAKLDGFELAEVPAGAASARSGLKETILGVNFLIAKKGKKQAQAHHLVQVINLLGLQTAWNLSPDDKEQLGLRRSVADCMGGHGLRLKKLGVRKGGTLFELPTEPITPAWLATKGITLDLGMGA